MQIFQNFDLSNLNTFNLNSTSLYYVKLKEVSDLPLIRAFIVENKLDYFILGGGSNVILPEKYNGIVIHNQLQGIKIKQQDDTFVTLKVSSGEVWDDFVKYTVSNNWYGIENLSGIPGTVGGAPIQNIGAYGVEVKEVITHVNVYDMNNDELKILTNIECEFSYRNSFLKTKPNYLILSVVFCLFKTERYNLAYKELKDFFANKDKEFKLIDVRNFIINTRNSKLPNYHKLGNVGSFFHNPIIPIDKLHELQSKYSKIPFYAYDDKHVKVAAGWLIDNLGIKGLIKNQVGVYDKQALVVVNYGGATSANILDFANYLIEQVFVNYQIKLNIEPKIV